MALGGVRAPESRFDLVLALLGELPERSGFPAIPPWLQAHHCKKLLPAVTREGGRELDHYYKYVHNIIMLVYNI